MGGRSSTLFLQRFPRFKEQWTNNQLRIAGFEKYTAETQGVVSNVSTTSLPAIREVNALGFFTVDSQDGNDPSERAYCEGFIPRALLEPVVDGLVAKKFQYIVYPNREDDQDIILTKSDTRVPYYDDALIKTYVIDKILNSTGGYYSGPPLKRIDLDMKEWVLILAFDGTFGHGTLEPDGLLTCMKEILTRALQPQQGGRRRKTRRNRRRHRTRR